MPESQPLPRRGGLLTVIFAGIVALALGGVWLADRSDESGAADLGIATESAPAPDFTVRLFDGSTFTLSEHLATDGRPVVLNFWASWCAPCRAEMPDFDRVAGEKPGVLVLGVAVEDTEENAREFADEVAVSYPLGLDSGGTISASYPYLGLPATWLIASDGTVVRQVNGQLSAETLRELLSGAFGL